MPLDRLRGAPYNPGSRLEARKLRKLADSMDLIGLIYPVVVTPDFMIVEGHRRTAAAKLLGWADIMCILTEEAPEQIYSSINRCAHNMTGNESLVAWLVEPRSIDPSWGRKYEKMMQVLGQDMVESLASEGYSYAIFDTAKRVGRYLGDMRPDFLSETVVWLTSEGRAGVVNRALPLKPPPEHLRMLIREDKPLKIKISLENGR